jgi:microcystin-dependent protein
MEEYLATVKRFAGTFAPRGFADCDGRLLPINQWQALFALLGTAYGGNGQTNLGLKRLSQHQPALPSATRQMLRQVFATQASCVACR